MRLVSILLLIISGPVGAQPVVLDTLPAVTPVEAALEGLALDAEAVEELAAWLDERRQDPLDLNTASMAELAKLPGLSPLLAHRIIQYRQRHGPLSTVDELLLQEGFTPELLHRLRPFVTARSPRSPIRPSGYVLQRFDYLPKQADEAYAGPPTRLQTRLRLRYRQLETALTLENDPGESLRWDPSTRTYGFDHQTGFVAWRGSALLRQLIVGDFNARFGSGLTLWSMPSIDSYQAAVDAPLRQGSGLTPYSGTDEVRYFRGLALTLALAPALTLSLFGSRRWLDARLDTLDASLQVGVTTLPTSGLHRTPAERRRKSVLRSDVLGGAMTFEHARGQLGVVGYAVHFDHPLQPSPAIYNRHVWRGRTAYALGFFGQLLLGQTLLSAEAGGTLSRPFGVVAAFSGPLGRFARGTLAFRYLPIRFVGLHADPFDTRSGMPRAETGSYAGLEISPAPGWQLRAAVDQYRFPWPRYGQFWPTTGRAHWLRLTTHPRSWLETYLQFRYDRTEERAAAPGPAAATVESTAPTRYLSVRWHSIYAFSAILRLEARLEYAQRSHPTPHATGWLFYQGLQWLPRHWLRLDARLTFFDSNGSLLLYAPEPSLRFSMALAALNNQGQRTLLRLELRPLAQLLLQLRYVQTLIETKERNIRCTWQFLLAWQMS